MERTGYVIAAMIATGVFLAGCESSPESAVEPGASSPDARTVAAQQREYADAVLELKRGIADPRLLEEKVQELKAGFPELTAAERTSAPEVSSGAAEGTRNVQAPALGKTAGTLVKNFDVNIRQSYRGSLVLYRGATVTITAGAIGTADPFLVLYEMMGPCNGVCSYDNAHVRAWNDDGGGGLSSRVTYTNTSPYSTPRTLNFIVFSANAEAGIGNVNITINNNGAVSNIWNVPARATGAAHNNVSASPCSEATGEYSTIALNQTGYFFTLNAKLNRATIRTSSESYSGWIPDGQATGYPHFVVGFVQPGGTERLGNIKQYDTCR